MTGDTRRAITVERTAPGQFLATSQQGARLEFGNGEGRFSPIELLLTALAGCGALDVEALTRRLAEPERLVVDVEGDKIRDEEGNNKLVDLVVTFDATFPAGEGGDAARDRLPDAVAKSHDRLCTVSRTIELGARIETAIVSQPR